MSDIRFSPDSWNDGALRFSAAAQDLASDAGAILGRCTDLGRAGCNNGGTLADAALSMIFPALFQAVQETVQGLTEGLGIEAQNMQDAAANYRAIEDENTSLARSLDAG